MATLLGTAFANTLHGTSGNDILAGLGGNDSLIGYAGSDTAWYGGLVKDYLIGTSGRALTLTDRVTGDGDDGSDLLEGVETLAFANGRLQVQGSEFQVNTYTNSAQLRPAVAALADGGFVLTWESFLQDGSSDGVYAQHYDAWGNAAGGEFRVNTTTTSFQNDPAIAALADGGFVVTWTTNSQDGDGRGIYAQRYDASGNSVGSEFQVNTYTTGTQIMSTLAALADGGFVITWSSDTQDGDFYGIYGQRYDVSGEAVGSEFRVNTTTANDQFASAITALADGGFVVTWESDGQDGGSFGVYAQRYDASGITAGSEFRVNTSTASAQYGSAVTALAGGGFVVTWQSNGQDGDGHGIYGQRFDAAGSAVGSEFRVNTSATYDQQLSAVAALAGGGFVVTWTSFGQDGSAEGVYAQRYDAAGDAAGSEFRVNTTTSDYQSMAVVGALADGGFVVTWESYGQDSGGYGIFAQRYDAGGNAVGLKVTGGSDADILNLGAQTLLTVDGAGGNDTITGGAGADNLFGGLGADRLLGSEGDDRLDGGTGNDVMIGGNGGDTYVVDSVSDVITESGTSGSDTVLASVSYTLAASLENLTLTGSSNLNGAGNASGNLLWGNAGNNTLDGRAGGDLMAGGDGNDVYLVDSLFDLVAENADQGTDRVVTALAYSLVENVEELLLTGAAAVNGTGNGLDNILDGNSGANTLVGGEGGDTLRGQGGNDVLDGGNGDDFLTGGLGNDIVTGGTGSDQFIFDKALGATNQDHITDFASGSDEIFLSMAIFTTLGGPGALSGADFTTGTGFAANATQRLLYDTGTGGLYYNADGSGAGALVLVATLDGAPTLASADFVLG